MKVLYIIGNGLDIAHNMKTSYPDFYKYYLSLPTKDKDIIAMKNDIEISKADSWADLEIGLGHYSFRCVSKEVFLKCLANIKAALTDYLKKESEKIEEYKVSSLAGFSSPGLFLEPEPRTRYDFYSNRRGSDISIDIITLNYTRTLEYLLNFKNRPLTIPPGITLRSIEHVHGTLDNMMVMGVNDSTQISNLLFNTDDDVVEDFVKPEYNDACMNNKNSVCESLIQKAEMIVLYGASLGLSDDKWWKLIGKRMDSDNYPLLVYLPFDAKKNQSAEPNHLRRWTREYVREVKAKFGIQQEEKELASRMCIAINKRLFPIIKNVQKNIVTK